MRQNLVISGNGMPDHIRVTAASTSSLTSWSLVVHVECSIGSLQKAQPQAFASGLLCSVCLTEIETLQSSCVEELGQYQQTMAFWEVRKPDATAIRHINISSAVITCQRLELPLGQPSEKHRAFLSTHDIMARCQIWPGLIPKLLESTVLIKVLIKACKDFAQDRYVRM